MAMLLLAENCTVTIAHSRTRDLPALVRTADIVVAAVGRSEMVRGDWIRPGATVIDVGINRIDDGSGGTRLVGDVAFAETQSCRRDHPRPRRGRPDDHRHALAQHPRRGASSRRAATSGRALRPC